MKEQTDTSTRNHKADHFIIHSHISTMKRSGTIIIAIVKTTKLKLKRLNDLPKVPQLIHGRAQAGTCFFLTQCMVQDDGPLLPLLLVSVFNRLFKCQRA